MAIKNDTINPKLIKTLDLAIEVPGVKVNRTAFLTERFKVTKEDRDKLLDEGPASLFTAEELDKAAEKSINYLTSESAAASFALGLPGGLAMAASIPADILQNMAFALRLAQELGYIYGYEDIMDESDKLTDEAYEMLMIFLGVMFGAQAAASLLRVAAQNSAKYAAKQVMTKALTKTAWYPLLKKISAVVAAKTLTKQGLAKGVAKIIPIIGGVASGALTFATMKPMGKRLKKELAKLVNYTEEDYLRDIKDVTNSMEVDETQSDEVEVANG
ncbi:MAG: EcsC family protein [Lactobacillales bacterium]|jgi:hypothetical protein|nr:EcsC family protein [Lactobacillales bacterium]